MEFSLCVFLLRVSVVALESKPRLFSNLVNLQIICCFSAQKSFVSFNWGWFLISLVSISILVLWLQTEQVCCNYVVCVFTRYFFYFYFELPFWRICWILKDIQRYFSFLFQHQNWTKMIPESDKKSTSTLKLKNQLNASRLDFSWFSGVQVGTKNQWKSCLTMHSQTKYILASIFEGFWWSLATKLAAMCLEDATRWPNLTAGAAQQAPRTRSKNF